MSTTKKKTVEPVVEETEAVDPALQAIIDSANLIEVELEAENSVLFNVIAANLLARFNLAKKTGINLQEIVALGTEISTFDFSEENVDLIGEKFYELAETIAGKKLASTWLDSLEGQKIGFMKPITDFLKASEVKKA